LTIAKSESKEIEIYILKLLIFKYASTFCIEPEIAPKYPKFTSERTEGLTTVLCPEIG